MKTIQELVQWFLINIESVIQTTLSAPFDQKLPIKKVALKPVKIKGNLQLQVVSFEAKRSVTKNKEIAVLEQELSLLFTSYQQIFIRTTNEEYMLTVGANGSVRAKKKVLESPVEPTFTVNRTKKYLIEEGKPIDFLQALGIMTGDGRVKAAAIAKFRQMNRFAEIVFDLLPKLLEEKKRDENENKTLSIIDFGCGKAYLTFALYYLLKEQYKGSISISITGVDLKKELVDQCNTLAKSLGYEGLHFVVGNIQQFVPQNPVDVVIALHACDTATDDALAQAMNWQVKALFVAPCCQHELYSQIDKKSFPILLEHGLFRERFAALATDALRVKLLEFAGYTVDVIEFVDPVHTPKNILIRGLKTGASSAPSQEYLSFVKLLGFKRTQ